MRIVSAITLACAFAASATLVGCKSGDDDDDSSTTMGDAGSQGDGTDRCKGSPQLTVGPEDGLSAMGENKQIQVRVIDADNVPAVKYYNTWTVQFLDAQGKPLDDIAIDKVCAYMPVHGHGTPPTMITQQTDKSTFELKNLNLTMPGPWQIQFALSSPSAATGPANQFVNVACDKMHMHGGSELILFPVCQPNP
jgi:hypothetical protein